MGCTPSNEKIDLTKNISIVQRNNKHLDLITDLIKAFPIYSVEKTENKRGGGLNPNYYNL